MRTLQDLTISEYDAGNDIYIRACRQIDGSVKWKVINDVGCVLNVEGEWEDEPMPSGRTVAYLARCRYISAELALVELEKQTHGK